MKNLVRSLWTIIVVELLLAIGLSCIQLRQAPPLLPEQGSVDADTWIDLTELSFRARTGGLNGWQDLADALVGKGKYAHAEIAYQHALRKDSRSQQALLGLAFCYDRTGRIHDSDRLYSELAKSPEREMREQCLYALARNALRLEESADAEKRFLQNIEFIPARLMYCKLLVDSGRSGEAKPIIDTFLKILPHSLHFQRLRYQACLQLGEAEEAQKAAGEVERSQLLFPINLHTDFLQVRNEKTGFLRLYGDYEKYAEYLTAQQRWDSLVDLQQHLQGKLSPYSVMVIKQMGDVAVELKDLEKLQGVLNGLDKLGIRDASTLRLQGEANLLAGAQVQAIAAWNSAVSMEPKATLCRKLSKLYLAAGDPVKGRAQEAIANFLDGQAAFHDSRLDESLELTQKAIQENPDDPNSWLLLCDIMHAKQDLPAALKARNKYLALSPACIR